MITLISSKKLGVCNNMRNTVESNDPIIENVAVPNVSDNVLKSAYAGMVLRQVASHAFRRNCQDVIFLQRKLSLNMDRLVSKK